MGKAAIGTTSSSNVAAALVRLIGIGPILGACFAGVLLYLPSHSIGEALSMSLTTLLVLGVLRFLDPHLQPVWRFLDRVPRLLRLVAGSGITVWYSISQFGPSAAGREVSTLRTTLLVSAVLGFFVLHPRASAT